MKLSEKNVKRVLNQIMPDKHGKIQEVTFKKKFFT